MAGNNAQALLRLLQAVLSGRAAQVPEGTRRSPRLAQQRRQQQQAEDEDGEAEYEFDDEDNDDEDEDEDDEDGDGEDGEESEDGSAGEEDGRNAGQRQEREERNRRENLELRRRARAIAAGDKEAQQALGKELHSEYVVNELKGSPAKLLRDRERLGHLTRTAKVAVASQFVPNTKTGILSRGRSHYFCGSHSLDGSVYMSACQDSTITLHDTQDNNSVIKTINARDIGWSVIDTDYSPDQRFLIYSSWSRYVHLCNVYQTEGTELHHPLDFQPTDVYGGGFCLFSVKFSSDSKEIIGGSSNSSIFVYNLEREARILQINGHNDDVNAVAWADDSSHLLYSGSDDCLCKVWDRRSLRDNQPVGVMAGHHQGITHIHPKGDGRYFISNGKDHAIKLWDLRAMSSSTTARATPRNTGFDYRYMPDGGRVRNNVRRLAGDTSLQTFTGHQVLRTLIRAKFSPAATTGQQYIYSGSADGNVYVWDIVTGANIARLAYGHESVVRDVSWHPFEPRLLSASWDNTVGIWDWKDPARLDGAAR